MASDGAMPLRDALETLHERYNTRARAARDPVSRVWRYPDTADRETAGLVAAMLAYGRLKQILASVDDALARLGPRPAEFLARAGDGEIERACRGFVHRFADADDLAGLLRGMRRALERHGGLESCFQAGDPGGATVMAGLEAFAHSIAVDGHTHLLADPSRGSACKRWHLYLRWMVRSDAVDPGCWPGVSPARLLVPLDAHMTRVCRCLGLTDYAGAGRRAALQATESFRRICPQDPVRYDFALMHASVSADPILERLIARRQGGT